tara:strand:- start:212 stop:571 length:360 start_codon:yes stop_codon:yes gene_type:complete
MTDITVKQGETYSARLVLKDESGTAINLSGYTVSGAAKYRYSNSGFYHDLNPTVISGTSGSLYASGYIDIDIASTVTATFPVLEANYEIKRYNSSGLATRTLYGNFLVAPGVTRIAESL